MTLEILKYPHPILCRKAEPVGEITPEIRQLAADMAETMYENRGIGLAATQVGACLRLVTIDLSGPEERKELMVLVNPRVAESSGETESEEGCLSVTDYRTNVVRAETVTVRATDLDGRDLCLTADGLMAICLQHELDHLDGILFIDRISRLKRSLYDKRLKKWTTKRTKDD